MNKLRSIPSADSSIAIVFLGNVRKGEFEQLLESNFALFLLRDKNAIRECATDPKLKTFSLSMDLEDLRPVLHELKARFDAIVLLALRESYVQIAASLREEFNLIGLRPSQAELCLDKSKFKKFLSSTPAARYLARSALIGDAAEATKFMNALKTSVVLKPINLASSLFVTKVTEEHSCARAFEQCLKAVQIHAHAKNKKNEEVPNHLLIEDWQEGSLHSVEILWDAYGKVRTTPPVDALTSTQVGGRGFQHCARYAPTALADTLKEDLESAASVVGEALGFQNTIGHVEFIYTSQGPRVLEIGARPGGHRIEILWNAFGIAFLLEHIRDILFARHASELVPKKIHGYGIVTPFPERAGRCTGLCNLQAFRNFASYVKSSDDVPKKVGTALDGSQSSIAFTYASRDTQELISTIHRVARLPSPFLLENEFYGGFL
jgi:predicted ATP-grasp superfamily ATP-dependent carboligase